MENQSSSSHSPTISLSSLMCHEADETTSCLVDDELEDEDKDENDDDDTLIHFGRDFENEDDYIRMLLLRETIKQEEISSTIRVDDDADDDWMNEARLHAMDYILNTRALLGFQFQTAFLSITYLDRFLLKRSFDSGKSWTVELLSVACLSLAAKLEECRVPSLSEFQVGKFKFENKIIQRMELLLLDTLGWNMASVTPFAYLLYFVNQFAGTPSSKEIVSRSTGLILAIAREINLMKHYQYAIACAAVLVAMYDQRLSRNALESKMNAIPLNRFIDIEDVFTCYSIVQQLQEAGKLRLPKLPVSQELSLSSSSSSSKTIASQKPPTSTSSISRKRKRLTFDDTGH